MIAVFTTLGVSIVLLIILAGVLEDKFHERSFLSPLIFISCGFIFAYPIRGFLTYFYPNDFSVFDNYYPIDNISLFYATLCLSFLGIFGLIFGYLAGAQLSDYMILPELSFRSDKNARYVSFILVIVSVAMFSKLLPDVLSSGSAIQLFSSDLRINILKSWSGQGQYLFLLLQLPLILTILMLSYVNSEAHALNKIFLTLIFILVALIFGIIGSRQVLLSLLMIVILFYHYNVRNIQVLYQIIILISVVTTGGILGLILVSFAFETNYSIFSNILWLSFVRFTQSFDQFEMLSSCLYRCDNFYFGLTPIEDVVLTYMPRSLFPFKPEIYGTLRAQNDVLPGLFDYAGLNATYPIGFLGEGYINYGPVGVFIFPFLFGLLLRLIYEKSKSQKGYMAVLIYLMANLIGIIRSFGGIIVFMILAIFMVKILYCIKLSADTGEK